MFKNEMELLYIDGLVKYLKPVKQGQVICDIRKDNKQNNCRIKSQNRKHQHTKFGQFGRTR